MKKIVAILLIVMAGLAVKAQDDTVKFLRVVNGANTMFQVRTANVDSIKMTSQGYVNIHYGDAVWGKHVDAFDSMVVVNVPIADTGSVVDTTAIDTSNMVIINYTNDSVSVINPYDTAGVAVSVSGLNVTVTSTSAVNNIVYQLSGTATGASFTMNTASKFILRLAGVNISSSGNKPTINIKDNKACVVHLVEGTTNGITDDIANTGKSAFYSKGSLTLQGGGSLAVTSIAVNGFQGKQGVTILDGTFVVSVTADAAKGIKTDGDFDMKGGAVTITALGTLTIDTITDENGAFVEYDKSYSSGIKTDGCIKISGGRLTVTLPESNAGGKCLSADSNIIVTGGLLTLSTAGAGACLGGTGTSAVDGYVCSCIKSDGNIYLYGGTIDATSTGLGGRGVSADGNLYVGYEGASNDDVHLHVQTSGNPVNPVNSGRPRPGQGQQTDDDYFKGLPKGIRIEGSIYIVSGHVASYCAQTGTDPNGEAIEAKDSMFISGGLIEANSYDDAINAGTYLSISGGKIWAYSRGNDAIDCNGARTVISGGLVLAKGEEVGIDANTDENGTFIITGGTIFSAGGNMGAWDTPTTSSSQKYLSLSSNGSNGMVILNAAGDTVLIYKNNLNITGSGFIDEVSCVPLMVKTSAKGGSKPGPGGNRSAAAFSSPSIVSGSYRVYSTATINGGSGWHGYYTGATAQTSGQATTVTAR